MIRAEALPSSLREGGEEAGREGGEEARREEGRAAAWTDGKRGTGYEQEKILKSNLTTPIFMSL
jgi:hypothetical protein